MKKAASARPSVSRTVPCPRCGQQVPIEPSSGQWIQHNGQVKGKIREMPCKASGIQGAVVKPDGSIRPRDRIDVLNDIDRLLGGKGDRKRKTSDTHPNATSKSIRTVGGGLPSLGKRRG